MSTFDSIGQEDLDRVRELAATVVSAPGTGIGPLARELAEAAAALVHDVEVERNVSRQRAADQMTRAHGTRPHRPMTLEEIEQAERIARLYQAASEPEPWPEDAPEHQGSIAAHIMRPGWITGGHYSPCCGAPVTPADPGDGTPACSHCDALIEHTDPNG